MAGQLIVSLITAGVVLVLGLFWMFFALVGLNGATGEKGGTILVLFAVLALATVVGSGLVSWAGVGLLSGRMRWSMWAAGPLLVVGVSVGTCAIMFAGFIILTLVVGLR